MPTVLFLFDLIEQIFMKPSNDFDNESWSHSGRIIKKEHYPIEGQNDQVPISLIRQGKWTKREKDQCIELRKIYKNNWRQIAMHLGTRTQKQVRSHVQKIDAKAKRHIEKQSMLEQGQHQSRINPDGATTRSLRRQLQEADLQADMLVDMSEIVPEVKQFDSEEDIAPQRFKSQRNRFIPQQNQKNNQVLINPDDTKNNRYQSSDFYKKLKNIFQEQNPLPEEDFMERVCKKYFAFDIGHWTKNQKQTYLSQIKNKKEQNLMC